MEGRSLLSFNWPQNTCQILCSVLGAILYIDIENQTYSKENDQTVEKS